MVTRVNLSKRIANWNEDLTQILKAELEGEQSDRSWNLDTWRLRRCRIVVDRHRALMSDLMLSYYAMQEKLAFATIEAPGYVRETLHQCLARVHQRLTACEQARERIGCRQRGLPHPQLRAFVHGVTGNHARITAVGLAALPDGLRIMLEHLRVDPPVPE